MRFRISKFVSLFKTVLIPSRCRCDFTFILWIYIVIYLIKLTDTPEVPSKNVASSESGFHPCCSYPCHNGGICQERGDSYICDCFNTGYYGKLCAQESWSHFLYSVLLKIAENIHFLLKRTSLSQQYGICHSVFYSFYVPATIENSKMNLVFDSEKGGSQLIYNFCPKPRILPPVPKNCSTLLVDKGTIKEMPNVDEIFTKLLKRDYFKKNKKGLNVLFAAYGMHFNLQFRRCSSVNMLSFFQVYEELRRSFRNGMFSTQEILGEAYPIFSQRLYGWIWNENDLSSKDRKFRPNILTYTITTVWMREHNRICNLLHNQWPYWEDELLFVTAKNIVIGKLCALGDRNGSKCNLGEMLVITMTEWLPLFGGYRMKLQYKPQAAHYGSMAIANSFPSEIYSTLDWLFPLPNSMDIDRTNINITDSIIHARPNLIHRTGLYNVLKSLASTEIGMMCGKNLAEGLSQTAINSISEGRRMRFPSFNQYRLRLGLGKLKQFSQLTNSKILANTLEQLYVNVDYIEFIVGVLLEEPGRGAVGDTLNHLISDWLFKLLITHPLGSKQMWKPSQMGGTLGWSIVQRANLIDLICLNVNESDICYEENKIGLKIPRISKLQFRTQVNHTTERRKESIFAKSKATTQ